MKLGIWISLLLAVVLLQVSCSKKENLINTPPNPVGPVSPVAAYSNVSFSAKGRVTDENMLPVQGAVVKLAGSQVVTDGSGNFSFPVVSGSEENAVVTVEKSGYFKGSRSFMPQGGNIHFVDIQLSRRNTFLTINASVGGTVTFVSGAQLQFPANALITTTGASFTGTAYIYVAYLNPVDNNFFLQMPGDLRAKDTAGATGVLRSFGMINAEIQTSLGEPLQVAPGKLVKITGPVQTAQQSFAPSAIPLWYWDEATGFWKQEGSAVRTGNAYVGNVSHFTTWNFDVTNGFAYIKAKFVTPSGNPVTYRKVKIIALNGPGGDFQFSENTTTDQGRINALAPIIIGCKIIMYDDCGQVLYTQTLSPLTASVDLGTITVSNAPHSVTIKGKVVDCSGNPLSNGKVFITFPNRQETASTNTDGTFILQSLGCLNTNQFTLYALNNATNEQNTAQTFAINNQDTVSTGNIVVCNNVTPEFIQIIRDVTDTFNYTYPQATTIFGAVSKPVATIDSSRTNIFAATPASTFYAGIIMNHVPYAFTAPGTMNIYSVSLPTSTSIPSYNPLPQAHPQMNITEYGAVGQYIAGNFIGQLFSGSDGLTHSIKISFRVKRTT